MHSIKKFLIYVMRLGPNVGVTPLKKLIYIGSKFHGYYIPENFFDINSVFYCVGAGEDISFDTELAVQLGVKVFIFDPAPEGINHFNKLKEATERGQKMEIDDPQSPFTYRISSEQVAKIKYIETGMWDKETVIRFYKPANPNYASHSIVLFKETEKFIEVKVDRLSNLMKKQNHTSVDLLKLEIEGAEYKVIDTVIEDKADVKMIAVEFDEVFHSPGFAHLFRIKRYKKKLKSAGYKLVHSSPTYKRLFIRKDIFEILKNRE